ncbi:MAG: preprotein translocase subunit SecG [Ignavibacteria bacterium]|nr:preprotein translocase subunit SecG [Ignavibacteria bacterium]
MFGVLLAIEIIVSILLMIVVLMQSSKGGGLAGSLGGSSMGTVFGVRRTADFLSRATTILATIFIGLCLITNIFFLPGKKAGSDSIIQKGATPAARPSALPPSSQPAATPQQQGK